MDGTCLRGTNYAKQKPGKMRQQIITLSKQLDVSPAIEIVLNGQEENFFRPAAMAKLGAIRVSFPTNVTEQCAIVGAKRDQIATAAVIGAEDEPPGGQVSEGLFDVERAKARAIAAHRDDFVVTELGNCLDRVLESLGKAASGLAMNKWIGNARVSGGREKMNVDRGRKFGGKRGKIQERPRRQWERAPGQINMRFLSEEENGASGHAFGYEKARWADKPFLFSLSTRNTLLNPGGGKCLEK